MLRRLVYTVVLVNVVSHPDIAPSPTITSHLIPTFPNTTATYLRGPTCEVYPGTSRPRRTQCSSSAADCPWRACGNR